MLKNYLKIAFRNLWKQKVYSFINILGLAVGMAACLLIYLFIDNELSFDRFHQKGEKIFRLNEVQSFEGISPQRVALSMYPMGPALKDEHPEIVDFVRFVGGGTVLRNDPKQIIVEKTFWTDPAFFSVFDFALRHGDRATALNEPNSAVLTAETAQKLFGTYLLLAPGTDLQRLEQAFPQFLDKHMGERKKFYQLYLESLRYE